MKRERISNAAYWAVRAEYRKAYRAADPVEPSHAVVLDSLHFMIRLFKAFK